jgi:uncharacterized protein (DUF1330 family)/uncharacterized protein YjiS (DUF1127 family)
MKRSIIAGAHDARGRMIRSTVAAAIGWVSVGWQRIHEGQRARTALRVMSDYELRDIGITRLGIDALVRRGDGDAPRQSHHYGRTIMSKAYWIVRVSVRDEARYPEYLAAAKPAFEKFGARFIVRGGAFEAMEGSARDRNVVVEFADRDTAAACYRSPEYAAAKSIRQQYADADFIIIDGA